MKIISALLLLIPAVNAQLPSAEEIDITLVSPGEGGFQATLGSGTNRLTIGVYNECKNVAASPSLVAGSTEGRIDTAGNANDGYSTTITQALSVPGMTWDLTALGPISTKLEGTKAISFSFGDLTGSPIYSESGGVGTVKFCARVAWSVGGEEVNFEEVSYDFSINLETSTVSLDGSVIIAADGALDDGVTSIAPSGARVWFCEGSAFTDVPSSTVIAPGNVFRICAQSTDVRFKIQEFADLSVSAELSGDTTTTTRNLVTGGADQALAGQNTASVDSAGVAYVDFFLPGFWYRSGQVTISGSATVVFSFVGTSRRVLKTIDLSELQDRALQATTLLEDANDNQGSSNNLSSVEKDVEGQTFVYAGTTESASSTTTTVLAGLGALAAFLIL